MVFNKWKPGSRIKADPEKAAEVLNQLADENRLNAENVVEASRPEDAVLHNEFEWDDSIAAAEYRKHQARNIINALIVVEEVEEITQEPIRCYFKIEEGTSNYTPISVILKNEGSMEALKRKALAELSAFKMKYNTIIKKCNAESDINSLQMKMENLGA